MYYDLTLRLTPDMTRAANEKLALIGHQGTHFDVMDKIFPLSYLRLPALVFDVSHVRGRDVEKEDIPAEMIQENMFIAFSTGFLKETGYGTDTYFREHVQLSKDLIHFLIEKKISIIGIDCTGIRRGKEHTPTDQYCADHDVFVIENMCGFEPLLNGERFVSCYINTYPVNYAGLTGLPCRVVAEK